MFSNNQIITTLSQSELRGLINDEVSRALQDYAPPRPPIKAPEDNPILTNNQLAKKLNVSLVTLYEWRRKGILPFFRINRQIRYNWKDVRNSLKYFNNNLKEKTK